MEEDEFLVTIPITLSALDVKIIVNELEELESSTLTTFLQDILKKVEDETVRQIEGCKKIRSVNPYSKNL